MQFDPSIAGGADGTDGHVTRRPQRVDRGGVDSSQQTTGCLRIAQQREPRCIDAGTDLDTRIVALGTLGQYTQRGEVRPPRAGRILLDGPVKATPCPNGLRNTSCVKSPQRWTALVNRWNGPRSCWEFRAGPLPIKWRAMG